LYSIFTQIASAILSFTIQKAILAAYLNPDPKVKEQWEALFGPGVVPTPEQLLEVLAKQIRDVDVGDE